MTTYTITGHLGPKSIDLATCRNLSVARFICLALQIAYRGRFTVIQTIGEERSAIQ